MVTPEISEVSSPSGTRASDLSLSDISLPPITSYKLNGNNYLPWSQSVRLYITGRRKASYLSESMTIPEESDPAYSTWLSENNTIMSWLINSMMPDIGENFMLYKTAAEIWTAARDTYSSADNTSELFGVENQIKNLRQADMTVTQYFRVLTRCWQQMDLYEANEWKCPDDVTFYNKLKNQKRVFQFLSGLNDELDMAKSRILATKPFPLVREAFSDIRREESRRVLMIPSVVHSEGSALLTNVSSGSRQKKGRSWCDHCKKIGHMRDQCWRLHGKPADWKPQRSRAPRDAQANMAIPDGSASAFSKEQLDELQQLFSHLPPKSATSAFTAIEGTGIGDGDWQC